MQCIAGSTLPGSLVGPDPNTIFDCFFVVNREPSTVG